mmetsp:Transcript_40882/g.108190  ORF Transcript_40882/g.108190 Transcript_40882/m.108190 type:complete len:392 (+) Transcript_40882:137-1312(+)
MPRFSEAQLARARLAGEPRQRASFALQDVAEWSRYQEQWYLLVTDEQLPEADRAAKWKAATRQWSKMNAQGLNDAQFLSASEPVAARQGGAARADRELSVGAADPACSCAAAVAEAQPYIEHAHARLSELRVLLTADSRVYVTFAGQGDKLALGTGLAVDQWRAAFPVRGDAARLQLVSKLEHGAAQLRAEFPGRVCYGRVSGHAASANNIQVWGANAANVSVCDGARIEGGGQAAAMGVQKPGIFGIVTTPLCGRPRGGSGGSGGRCHSALTPAKRAAEGCVEAPMPPQVLVMEVALYGANGEQVGSSELQMGVGRWEQVGPLHWASHKVHGVGGDGRMHLWRWDEHWMVTSSEGHMNTDEPEYPWITSDFVGPSPCGWYQHGLVRFVSQ